jgi:hypothetical protein
LRGEHIESVADDLDSSSRSLRMRPTPRQMTNRLGGSKLPHEDGFPKLSAPARRALSAAGYARLDQLAQASESDLKKLHGMGPTAIDALRAALRERGLDLGS